MPKPIFRTRPLTLFFYFNLLSHLDVRRTPGARHCCDPLPNVRRNCTKGVALPRGHTAGSPHDAPIYLNMSDIAVLLHFSQKRGKITWKSINTFQKIKTVKSLFGLLQVKLLYSHYYKISLNSTVLTVIFSQDVYVTLHGLLQQTRHCFTACCHFFFDDVSRNHIGDFLL